MFTGIIEATGQVVEITSPGTNKTFWIFSPFSNQLRPDQSVSHNGVCLTVEEIKDQAHRVTAIAETLKKSNLGELEIGDVVNLERCMVVNGRLDGHVVQGHVDATGKCLKVKKLAGSYEYRFQYPGKFAHLIIEKGSISLNGISLTIFDVSKKEFSVAIIPYTYEHTNIQKIRKGSTVNLEFDLIGKYVARMAKSWSLKKKI
jgi:riboflavin synthase